MTNEQWQLIPGYQGLFEASTEGRIRSRARKITRHYESGKTDSMLVCGTVLRPHIHELTGYSHVCLKHDGLQFSRMVHRLIALTFLGSSKMEVNHRDGNKTNNTVSNLEYVTRSENERHALQLGLKTRLPNGRFSGAISKAA